MEQPSFLKVSVELVFAPQPFKPDCALSDSMAGKPRILIFSTFYFPFVGGAEVALKEVITRLNDRYDFTIITAKLDRTTKREETMNGIRVIRVGTGIAFFDKLLYPLLCTLKALFLPKPDLLFVLLENQAAIASNLYLWFRHVPSIYNMQNGDTEAYIRKRLGLFYFLYLWTYNKKHHYVVLSEFLKQRAINHGVSEHQIDIVPNGVNTSHFDTDTVSENKKKTLRKKHDLADKKIIFTASRLAVKNGIGEVIRAMPTILADVPNAVFVIAGTGELDATLKQLVKELDLEKHVRFVGFVSHDELPAYLVISDVFIRPSLSEGFGNSFVEALSCGVPIIGTRVGGIPDFLEHEKTGLFADVGDPHDIARQIVRLFEDDTLARTIATNGQQMVKEHYEWDAIAERFDALFQNELKQ